MLKKITIKGQKIPVPVPVKTLSQALDWVDDTLVKEGQIVTKVTLDRKNIDDDSFNKNFDDISLSEASDLEFVIETPKDLALQALESINKLCGCLHHDLKLIAVECWQLNSPSMSKKLEMVNSDINLFVELIDHLVGLIDAEHVEAAPVQGLRLLILRVAEDFAKERKNRDWKRCSRILLNRLEPLLSDLTKEAENLQMQVFASTVSLNEAMVHIVT